MCSPGRVLRLAAVLQLGRLAFGELSDAPSPANFVRKFSNAVVVLGDYAYVDGGEIIQMENGKMTTARNVNSTLSIDLTKSWTTTEAVFRKIPKAPSPVKGNAAVWTNQAGDAFYSWGGKSAFGVNLTEPALWKFAADGSGGGSWAIEPPSNPSRFNELTPVEFAAITTVNNTVYAIGGTASSWTKPGLRSDQVIPGMLTFNMDTREWTNGTKGFSPLETLTHGTAQYLHSFGPNGLILLMGGYAPKVDQLPAIANSFVFDFRNLTFFDPVTKKTYWQIATGEIPSHPRLGFCSAAFKNPEGGHEIFIFGGQNSFTGVRYNDAYILSFPGFVWTKAPDAPAGGRFVFGCAAVGKRQVLTVGGLETKDMTKDKAPQGMLVFDATALKWNDFYQADAPAYERAEPIKAWYRNKSLDRVEWASEEVQRLFFTSTTGSPGGSGDSGGPGSAGPNDGSSSGGAPTGVIAGGVVGGLAALMTIAVAVWLVIRRKKQRAEKYPSNLPEVATHRYIGCPGTDNQPVEVGASGLHIELPVNHWVELPSASPNEGRRHFVAELDGRGYR